MQRLSTLPGGYLVFARKTVSWRVSGNGKSRPCREKKFRIFRRDFARSPAKVRAQNGKLARLPPGRTPPCRNCQLPNTEGPVPWAAEQPRAVYRDVAGWFLEARPVGRAHVVAAAPQTTAPNKGNPHCPTTPSASVIEGGGSSRPQAGRRQWRHARPQSTHARIAATRDLRATEPCTGPVAPA